MKYSEFSTKTFYSILSFYGELIEKNLVMSAPEIGKHLGFDATTIRRFIDQVKKTTYIYQNEDERINAIKLYEEIVLHTNFLPNTERYKERQQIKRKRLEILVKQKTKEYNLKRVSK